ncbi:MAG: RluA family pseudouridine synthase, partial [Armatimonadetes bacterium]|nr:RluA family pseudouridine synthase [Armatimonadota bacterium]
MTSPSRPQLYVVSQEAAGQRLDLYLAAELSALTRSQAKRLIDQGDATVDGQAARAGQMLKPGQVVALTLRPPEPSPLEPAAIPLDVVYEDGDLLVVNKPAGLVTHPARGNWSETLVNALLAHCTDLSGIGGELRPGIVHRLDKDTTGLLVVAKHDQSHVALANQLSARTAGRKYLALVYGDPPWDQTTVDAAVARHRSHRDQMAIDPAGRAARTHLACLERFGLGALLKASLETGRTHQVRVHCTHLGHPLYGDRTYGLKRQKAFWPLPAAVASAEAALDGQALHAAELDFRHPADGRPMHFA